MKVNYFSSCFLSFLLLASLDVLSQSGIPASFYPSGDIQAILAQAGCTGIRIYPVFDEKNQTNSTMIIGVNAYGYELQNDSSAVSQYRLFTGISDQNPTTRTLTRNEAYAAYATFIATHNAFVSDLSSGVLERYLNEESLGISLLYSTENGNNFNASGYKVDAGVQAFGVASPGDPCPTACGSRERYLISPQ